MYQKLKRKTEIKLIEWDETDDLFALADALILIKKIMDLEGFPLKEYETYERQIKEIAGSSS